MKIHSDMFAAVDIAISGLKAHGKHMELIGSNVANARTTDAGNGQPYRKLEAVFEAKGEDEEGYGVELAEIVKSSENFRQVLMPGHPQADADGYVLMPNVNLPMELISLNQASRGYKANAAMLKRYTDMVKTSLELLK